MVTGIRFNGLSCLNHNTKLKSIKPKKLTIVSFLGDLDQKKINEIST
jgi:hypothetical protein